MKRVRRAKADLLAGRDPVVFRVRVVAVADVRAAVAVAMAAGAAMADAAARAEAGGIAFLTRIIANPRDSRGNRAGRASSQ